ncbi:hypothetical protein HPB51_006036 [Rhipicephalus microplus]|uniref:Parvovirus non-structural protein 1 helicase domain-containing protein n=1 Tax=Rhipicephalus microplus TaxID=6941 RepID=A0A9J6DT39_RHIMP|nr:hypothetical protein HPB51_006036 [Rhipicephalus microplus]
MCFPLETTQKLRQFVMTLSEDLNKDPPVACNDAHGGQTNGGDADKVCARKGTKCRKRAKGASEESIYDWLRENPVSPLSNIVRTPKELADPVFRFIRLDDKRLQRAIQVFIDEMCSYSTLDFIEMYKNTQPLFDAPHGDLATVYMDVPASFDAMMELLNFQFHGIHEEVSAFVNNLYSLNTVGRRILVWNELNCESSAFETVKKIFGGDADSVVDKHAADQTISRTPVIVLSNKQVFPDEDAFNHRVWRYK